MSRWASLQHSIECGVRKLGHWFYLLVWIFIYLLFRNCVITDLITHQGTTRDNFDNKPVAHLSYTSYPPLALQTLLKISRTILTKHSLIGISVTHRLGTCPVGEESILIAVSAPHRKAAWDAGEECLEMVKEKAEIWKLETFKSGKALWRANRNRQKGVGVGVGSVNKEAGLEGGLEGVEGGMEEAVTASGR